MVITQQQIEERLMARYGYNEREAASAAAKLSALQPALQEAFLRWWETAELPEMEVEGYTAQELIEDKGMMPPAAILALDWLMRQPDVARAALERKVDYIERPQREE